MQQPRMRLFAALAIAGILPLLAVTLLEVEGLAILWLIPVMLAVCYGLALWLARPLEELRALAQRIRAGNLQASAVIPPGSVSAEVSAVLTNLATRLDQVTRDLEGQVQERTASLSRKAGQLRAVGQVGQQVAAVLEPESLLPFVVRMMRGTFGYDTAAVVQRHGEHLVLTAGAARGVEEVPLGRAFPLAGPGAPPLATAMTGAGGVSRAVSPLVSGVEVKVELAVPIQVGDRTLGVLAVQNGRTGSFDEEDLFTVQTIAGQVAVALENARLLEAERQLRDLSITDERNRMAREIHDTLAQGFMGIIMHLRAMQGAADNQTAHFHRQQAEELARESLQEARRSVWNLRPQPLEGKGLAGALAAEANGLRQRTGIQVDLQTEGDVDRLPSAVEAALLRIAQEALHNIAKYAEASTVSIRLTGGDAVSLVVADNGVGFDPAAAPAPGGGGFGLKSMAERARLLGGHLVVETAPGQGCCVIVRIPVSPSAGRQ